LIDKGYKETVSSTIGLLSNIYALVNDSDCTMILWCGCGVFLCVVAVALSCMKLEQCLHTPDHCGNLNTYGQSTSVELLLMTLTHLQPSSNSREQL